jgi:hypothetical protein
MVTIARGPIRADTEMVRNATGIRSMNFRSVSNMTTNSEKLIEFWVGWENPHAITVHLWGRMTGKTTACIEHLENNPGTVCIVPNLVMKRATYPRHLHNRIYSIRQLDTAMRGVPEPDEVIIDEVGFMGDRELFRLCQRYNVTHIYLSPKSFLMSLMLENGIDTRTNELMEAQRRRAGLMF